MDVLLNNPLIKTGDVIAATNARVNGKRKIREMTSLPNPEFELDVEETPFVNAKRMYNDSVMEDRAKKLVEEISTGIPRLGEHRALHDTDGKTEFETINDKLLQMVKSQSALHAETHVHEADIHCKNALQLAKSETESRVETLQKAIAEEKAKLEISRVSIARKYAEYAARQDLESKVFDAIKDALKQLVPENPETRKIQALFGEFLDDIGSVGEDETDESSIYPLPLLRSSAKSVLVSLEEKGVETMAERHVLTMNKQKTAKGYSFHPGSLVGHFGTPLITGALIGGAVDARDVEEQVKKAQAEKTDLKRKAREENLPGKVLKFKTELLEHSKGKTRAKDFLKALKSLSKIEGNTDLRRKIECILDQPGDDIVEVAKTIAREQQ